MSPRPGSLRINSSQTAFTVAVPWGGMDGAKPGLFALQEEHVAGTDALGFGGNRLPLPERSNRVGTVAAGAEFRRVFRRQDDDQVIGLVEESRKLRETCSTTSSPVRPLQRRPSAVSKEHGSFAVAVRPPDRLVLSCNAVACPGERQVICLVPSGHHRIFGKIQARHDLESKCSVGNQPLDQIVRPAWVRGHQDDPPDRVRQTGQGQSLREEFVEDGQVEVAEVAQLAELRPEVAIDDERFVRAGESERVIE